jgi:hypothetical protein
VSGLRVSDHAGDLQTLFRRQPDEFESGTHVGSVPHDGHSSDWLITQLEINGDRFSDIHLPLQQGSQAAFSQIEADAVRAPYAGAQMTERNGDAKRNSGMLAERFIRTVSGDSRVKIDRHGSILLALIVHAKAAGGRSGPP